jgi:voltage-gated potassium channel
VSDLAPAAGAELEYASLKRSLREAVASDPFDAAVVTVAGGAFLFYLAEKGHNQKVNTYWDALVFVSTCMSVGYADVFARTPAGKAIASAVMTLGPALSGALLDEPRAAGSGSVAAAADAESAERIAIQRAIVDKLEAILAELRASRRPA